MLRELEVKEKKGINIYIIFIYSFFDGLFIFKDVYIFCK